MTFFCQIFEIPWSWGGGGSQFWQFRGFVRLDKCILNIFETYIRKIYLWSRDSIWQFSTANHLVNRGWRRVPQLFQRNNLRAYIYIENFWDFVRFRKIVWILVNGSCFSDFCFGVSIADSAIWLNVPKKGVFFDVLIKGFFCRNVIFGM